MEVQVSIVSENLQKADFAAGCFWHVEEAFRHVPGVVSTAVGYEGGHTQEPSYKEICTDRTGHAETVQVTYDPEKVSYEDLLNVFWEHHDPTTPNRQGPDFGTQYRSTIFYYNAGQEAAAKASREKLPKIRKIQETYRHRDPARLEVLESRGIPPAVPGKNNLKGCGI